MLPTLSRHVQAGCETGIFVPSFEIIYATLEIVPHLRFKLFI